MRNFQRSSRFLFFFLCLFLLPGLASAKGEQILKVGYIPGTGFYQEDWPGHVSGYGYEFMQSLSSYADCDFVYVPLPNWEACIQALIDEKVDVIPGMPGDPRRSPGIKRTDHVVGRFMTALVVHTGQQMENAHLRLGIYEKSFPIPKLPMVAQRDGFTYDLQEFSTNEYMQLAFDNGEIDGYVAPMLAPNPGLNREVRAQFDRQSYRLVVKENRPELFERINTAMEYLLIHQPEMRNRLFDKYIRGDGGLPLNMSRQEENFLKERGKLTAMVFGECKPLAYFEDGEAKGIVPEILRLIAKDLKIGIEFIEPKNQEDALVQIRSGNVDLLANLYSDYSWANMLGLRMATPYLTVDYVPVTRRHTVLPDRPSVACPAPFFYLQGEIKKYFAQDQIVFFDSVDACLDAVSSGKADQTFLPSIAADYLVRTGNYHNLQVGSDAAFSHDLSIGVSHGADSMLLSILNQEINHHIDRSNLRMIVHEATQVDESHLSLTRFLYLYPMQVLLAVALLAALVILGFWYRAKVQKTHLKEIEHVATHDLRTGLPNLTDVENRLPGLLQEEADAYRHGRLYVVLLTIESKVLIGDVKGMDLYMDKLREFVTTLREEKPWIRLSGITRGHPLLICCVSPEEDIAQLTEQALHEHGYLDTQDNRIWLNPSAGICRLKAGEYSFIEASQRADIAAHEIHGTKQLVRLFDEKLAEELTFQQQLEQNMEEALKSGEFHAWYQPKYDLATKRQCGAEALVRWISPKFGFLPPGKFIPLFERNGFVLSIDYALLEQSFALQRRRLDAGLPIVTISVNQSRLHLTEEGYLDRMREIVNRYQVPAGAIELELTETIFGDMDDTNALDNAQGIVKQLHDMGFSISVDDFGSGYSSFMMLNQLPMDVMKIDRSLLNVSEDSARMRSILTRVIQLGRDLKMKVLCEGIETPEQENLLLELGCQYGQGYLNGKPMPEEEFERFLAEKNG